MWFISRKNDFKIIKNNKMSRLFNVLRHPCMASFATTWVYLSTCRRDEILKHPGRTMGLSVVAGLSGALFINKCVIVQVQPFIIGGLVMIAIINKLKMHASLE